MIRKVRLLYGRAGFLWALLALLSTSAFAQVANDNCAGAITVPVNAGACTNTVSADNTNATASAGVPPPACAAYVSRDLWFSVTVPASGNLTVQTVTPATGFGVNDTGMSIYAGTCSNLSQLGCDDDGAGNLKSQLTFTGRTPGEVLYIRVWAYGDQQSGLIAVCATTPVPLLNDNCAGAIPLAVTATCVAPVAGTLTGATQSLPPTVNCGGVLNANDVWYSFVASGATQSLVFGGNFGVVVDVRAGTCASSASVFCSTVFGNQPLVLSGLTSGQAYFLRVYSSGTFLPPNPTFTLCLNPAPTPAINDNCTTAIPLPVTATCAAPLAGTVLGASQSLPATLNCGPNSAANDVWFSFVASGTTQQVSFTGFFTAVIDVRAGTCAASTSLFCGTTFTNQPLTVTGLTTGQPYFLRLYLAGGGMPTIPTFTLCLNPGPTPPANDECAGAIAVPVTAACGSPVSGTVAAASQSLPASTCGVFNATAADVWYSFVATSTAQLITFNAQYNAVLEVRSGTCASSSSVSCATTPFNGGGTTIGGLTTGQTYFLRIYANSTIQPPPFNATFTLCITTPLPPPINDDCAGALPVPVQFGTVCVSQTSADNTNATASGGAPVPNCAGYQGRDLWFSVTVPASGTVTVRTVAPTVGTDIGDTGMSMYAGTCGFLNEIGCDDDGAGNLKSQLIFSGRTPGEVLYIRVWGYGNSIAGTIAVCATSPTNCATPTTPMAASVTSSTAQLSWQPGGLTPVPAGLTYTVEYGLQGFAIGAGTVLSGLTTPGTLLTSLQSNTAYCFYVRQDCPGGNGSSAYAGPVCFITPCAVPTALTATAITATTAVLGWQVGGPLPGGTTFTIEYGPQGFPQGTGSMIAGATATSFPLGNLQAGTAYCFYVRQDCPGSTGNGTFAGPVCFTTAAASTTCLGPTALTAASLTQSSALLSWQPGGPPATGTTFTIQYGLQGFVLGAGITVGSLTVPGYALTGLAATTGYCFYVRQNCPGTAGSSAYVGPICFSTTNTGSNLANDEPCGAVSLNLPATTTTGPTLSATTVGATTSAQPGIGAPTCSPNTTPRDVWFTMTPAAGVISVTLNLTGTAAGIVRVFTAPNCTTGPFTQVLCRSSGTNNTGLNSLAIPTVPGQTYYVAISSYGAADTPGGFTITSAATVTATRPAAAANALLVYPNPSNTGQLTLKLSTAGFTATRVSLVNALGQVVRAETLRNGSTEQLLSTVGLATGIYTVRVVVGNEVLTRKVVLE